MFVGAFFVSIFALLNFQSKDPQGYGYCVFGKVIAGMDIVDQIKVVETTSRNGHQDVPAEPIMITKATAINETVSAD